MGSPIFFCEKEYIRNFGRLKILEKQMVMVTRSCCLHIPHICHRQSPWNMLDSLKSNAIPFKLGGKFWCLSPWSLTRFNKSMTGKVYVPLCSLCDFFETRLCDSPMHSSALLMSWEDWESNCAAHLLAIVDGTFFSWTTRSIHLFMQLVFKNTAKREQKKCLKHLQR